MKPATLHALNVKVLSTVHNNFKQEIESLFEIRNGDNPNVLAGYNETTALVQNFLKDAVTKGKSVRVLGGNWSWTTVGFTKDWMVSTTRLNRIKRTLPEEICARFESDRFVFAQCGCSVLELNRVLQSLGRALPTSGASNGQTIAGLISNGTHGSAIDFGSTPEFVTGLHLIVSPGKHVYLQRASYPVVTPAFVKKIGAELLTDDALFNAALVSFGSVGFIHGVMIETSPLQLYNVFRKQVAPSTLRPLMQTLDFKRADFSPHPGRRPFHFNVIINPHQPKEGYYATFMYKEPYRENYPRYVPEVNKAGPGEDAPILLGKLSDAIPVITPLIVNQTIQSAYKTIHDAWGTHGEIFNSALAVGRVLSTAIGIPLERTNDVLDIALHLNKQIPFTGVMACRFVKQSGATLAFTQFPTTCILEFDSFEAKSTRRFYAALWEAVEKAGIPFTFHWGKINNLDAGKIRKMYGRKVDEWIKARNQLLPKTMLPVFTNGFMVQTGLDAVVTVPA